MKPQRGKRELIDKANSSMVAVVAVSAFLIVFSLIASKALWSQRSYQSKVISKKEEAVKQLESNKEAVEKLKVSYATFINTPDNIIGGNPNGTGDRDGNNSKIILDALPSKYDFPAFITSIKKLLATKNLELKSITGTDDEVAQNTAKSKGAIEIPFEFTSEVNGFAQAKDLLIATEQSIRPIKIKKATLTGKDGQNLTVGVTAVSNYQGAKGLTITKEVVKQ
jgi:hypothetical protein